MKTVISLFLIILATAATLYFLTPDSFDAIPSYLPQQIILNQPIRKSNPEIERINQKNLQIKTFSCQVDIEIPRKITFHMVGSINYEKDKKFRMVAESRMGKEIDIGSNQNYFWFWSKRMQPPNLYYASYDHLMQTSLKTPFNPLWMMESLGLNEIILKNKSFYRYGNYLIAKETKLSTQREPVVQLILVDPNKNVIIGNYLYKEGKLIASTEITSFTQNGSIG